MAYIAVPPPTWSSIIHIHINNLENPKVSASTKQAARIEILRLAKLVDISNEQGREETA